MRLSDVISSMGLTAFPIIGLLLFLSVFVGVVIRVTRRDQAAELERAGSLPLEDEVVGAAVGVSSTTKPESSR